MSLDTDESDITELAMLRAQAERLEALERRIAELESERSTLLEASDRLNAELARQRQIKEEWDWFFDHSLDLLCLAGSDGYFKRVNRAFVATLGFTAEELISRPFIDFVHPDDVSMTLQELGGLTLGADSVHFENRYRDAKGNWHWLAWRCPAPSSSNASLYAIARDVTENKRTEAEVLFLATHDVLTGLANRVAFESELVNAMARASRNPAAQIVFFIIDLDGFKSVNDTYGHVAGDELLRQIGSRFASIRRRSDFVCRLGGDEFVWMAEGLDGTGAAALANRLLDVSRMPINIDGIPISISCSIGCSTFPDPAGDAKSLLEQADKALYMVKGSGKNQFLHYKLPKMS